MRLSVNRDDPGYSPIAYLARVWLAGSERMNVLTADEEQRWALVHMLDADGRCRFTKEGKAMTEEFWGSVRIEPATASWCPEA